MSTITAFAGERFVGLPDREKSVEESEAALFESFTALEEKRETLQREVAALRITLNDVPEDSTERDAIESSLLGVESTGEGLEDTYEPILELRLEMLERREALCTDVSRNIEDFETRIGRAVEALSRLRLRAEKEAAQARSAREVRPSAPDIVEAEPSGPDPLTPLQAPSPPAVAESSRSKEAVVPTSTTTSLVDISARITAESEDNFYDGLDTGHGVFVSTIQILPLGQRVHVRIDVEGVHSVNAHGVVRWYRDWDDDQPHLHPGMGIEFDALGDDEQRVVEDFVSRREPWLFV